MLVDSKKKELGIEPIIVLAAAETKEDIPVINAWAAAVAEMNMKNTTLFREGNTLFIVHHVEPRVGYFRAWNADVARNYLENAYLFFQAAHKYGYDVLYTNFSDPTLLNIFKAIFRNPPLPDMDYEVTKEGDEIFVTLKLGKPREV